MESFYMHGINNDSKKITCPKCNGKGYTEWYHHHTDPCLSFGMIRDKCNRCDGTGYVEWF